MWIDDAHTLSTHYLHIIYTLSTHYLHIIYYGVPPVRSHVRFRRVRTAERARDLSILPDSL